MAEYALLSSVPAEEYETWVVKNLEELRKYKPKSLALVAIPGDGESMMLTAYYNAGLEEKHVMAAAIQDDATDQLIRANMGRYLEELEDEEEEQG